MSQVTVKGGPVSIGGEFPAIGETAKDFSLAKKNFKHISEYWYTYVCTFSQAINDEAANLDNTVVLCISADLPFAQKRFCGAEGTENIETLSAFRNIEKFSTDYGELSNIATP